MVDVCGQHHVLHPCSDIGCERSVPNKAKIAGCKCRANGSRLVRVVVGGGAGVGHRNRQDCRQCSKQTNKNYWITLQLASQLHAILGAAFLASAHIADLRCTQNTRITNVVRVVGEIRVATSPVRQQAHLHILLAIRLQQPHLLSHRQPYSRQVELHYCE